MCWNRKIIAKDDRPCLVVSKKNRICYAQPPFRVIFGSLGSAETNPNFLEPPSIIHGVSPSKMRILIYIGLAHVLFLTLLVLT